MDDVRLCDDLLRPTAALITLINGHVPTFHRPRDINGHMPPSRRPLHINGHMPPFCRPRHINGHHADLTVYLEAEEHGRLGNDCGSVYSSCPVSLFTMVAPGSVHFDS